MSGGVFMSCNETITNLFTKNLTQKSKALLMKQADNLLNTPYPVILASDYSLFSKTGNRVSFEDIYFTRRRMFNAFVLAELADDTGRYLDRIIDGIFLLCEESGWQLPPHNSYGDGLGNQPYSDITRPVLDLFSCETGALLAFASTLLKNKLDKVSPIICTRINYEVTNRILIPYSNTFVWWMGNGTDKTCNWTPWCTQNVLIAAICSDIPEDTKNFIFAKATKSLTYFFNDYGFDGCCDEGALYYRHAGLCLWLGLEILKSQNMDLKFFTEQNEKLKNIAEYIMNVHVTGQYYINFADCAPNPGPCSVREFLFGKMVGSKNLMKFAAEDFCNNDDYLMSDEINLCYRFITLIKEQEICNFNEAVDYDTDGTSKKIKHIYYESTGLSIYKTNYLCLAAKAGNNNDSHNHNDTGSITLYMNDKPCLIDLGVESYTAKTFSADRYSIWTMQSSYHNLPDINGFSQLVGPEYKAEVLKINDNMISMDVSGAYDVHTGINSFIRTVYVDTTDSVHVVRLKDKFDFTDKDKENIVIENFMTCYKPLWNDEGILQIGDFAFMKVDSYKDCFIEEIPVTDPRLKKSYTENVYRIRFTAKSEAFSCEFSVSLH